MKAVLDIEFILSVFVFLASLSFATAAVGRNIPVLKEGALVDTMRSESYQISELLVATHGAPENWETVGDDEIERIGLARENNVLESRKVDRLQELCRDDYEKVNRMLQQVQTDVVLELMEADGTNALSACRPAVDTHRRPIFSTRRTAVLNGQLVSLNVSLVG